MKLQNESELANTREKLSMLEQMHRENEEDLEEVRAVRELTGQSLKKLINQLKEEIAVFEARRLVRK